MKENISVRFIEEKDEEEFFAPLLIEGLPGIGHVGKLVAEHLIQELGAEKIAEITSLYFPPQVILGVDGVTRLCNNELYHYQGDNLTCLFLVGDFQSTSNEGHYHLSSLYVDIAHRFGVKRIYTLGGYGVGHFVETPRILGAVNQISLKEEIEKTGVIFGEGEPGGGIIGAAGLMLGFAQPFGIEGVCLMGETSGYLVDPKSATLLLEILCKLIGIEVDTSNLHERAAEMEDALSKIAEQEKGQEEELSYIG
ncbi:MAG: proteasome assembly chaperone family protein [Methanospirillaceae archaeon]|nr:proteasome assembly chaperone family protein [Methanospirillaceae archaeon]